ncbi:hypothetical protein LDENG_00291660 [Lucifuga dentata]|nr:hypothetical protein LDENG_00291660 [Lucifuga dentata]
MASSRVLEREVQEKPRRPAAANLDLCLHKYSLLIIIGRTGGHPGQAGHISKEIERGIRSWDVDLLSCNLNLFLQEFLSHHTVSFKGAGQKCLHHSTKVLDTQVLISPSQDQVHSEVFGFLSSESAHKLLILAGQSVEESGDLLFHRGHFSPHKLKEILTEQFIDEESAVSSLPSTLNLTLSCPNIGQWRKTLLGNKPLLGPFTLHINLPEVLPAMEALGEFTSLVSGTLSSPSPFDLLPPPGTVGFLKLSRPCCYVFPAGRGDCAFFAVSGFTVLVDGGSDSQACFWKLVRHLDRVDAVLLTHIGTENLPGVNAFLERKVAELELRSDVKDDSSKRLISPELGVVFFNTPSRLQIERQPFVDNVLKSTDQATLTLKLLKKLDIRPQPMFRQQGAPIEPITLFQKMGVGQLELYIINPGKNSQEYHTLMQNWPDAISSASKSQTLPLTALASVCALLVWHPACPQEKVVRVLFPGVTPQAKLLEGLEKLKGLPFLQKPTVTTGDLEKLEEDRKAKRTESQESGKSQGKETTPRQGKERVDREEGRETPVKEKGKVLNGVRTSEILEPGGSDKDQQKQKLENDPEENVCGSKMSTPEDMTADFLKLREETEREAWVETEDKGKQKSSEPGNEKSPGGLCKETSNKAIEILEEEKAGGTGIMDEESDNNRGQRKCESGEKADVDLLPYVAEQPGSADKSEKTPKVVGFPSHLNKSPKSEHAVQLHMTPAEYNPLDDLKNSPPSRSSPENQAPLSPDEETVEPISPDSRPNSAGHTPYCLSPDDVWDNRATLSRIQAQISNLDATDVNQPNGLSKDGQICEPEGTPDSHATSNPKEKHLSFLSLGSFKDGGSDPSPSIATTTTTHSMPAEVSSPQSTEVDESLSMSFEQGPTAVSQRDGDDSIHHSHSNGGHFVGMSLPMKKPPRPLGQSSEMGHQPAPSNLHFEVSSHDVDLCLVSPCEFKHFKPADSNSGASEPSRGALGPHHHGNNNNNNPKDTSVSESNAPVCTEDCPSTTADGALDSDEEESYASMPVPQSDFDAHEKRTKSTGMRGKKAVTEASPKSVSGSVQTGKRRTGSQNGGMKETKDNHSATHTPSCSPRTPAAKSLQRPGSKSTSVGEVSLYVDLAYIPSGASSPTVNVDFFKCVRSSCYIISGDSPQREEIMRSTLDALLDGKTSWPDTIQVTVIPTFESLSMQEWYQQTLDRQRELGITVLGSNSTVAMQDETFPACKIEF